MFRVSSIFILLLFIISCSHKTNDEVIGEVEQNIQIKLPASSSVVDHKAEGVEGNYSSHTNLEADADEITELVIRIRNSKDFIGNDKLSAMTNPVYWTRSDKYYLFKKQEADGSQVTFKLDTVSQRMNFELVEKN